MAHPILNGVYQHILDLTNIKHHEKIIRNSDSILIYCFPFYSYPTSVTHGQDIRPWTINNTYISLSIVHDNYVRIIVSKKDFATSDVNVPWYGLSCDTLLKEFDTSRIVSDNEFDMNNPNSFDLIEMMFAELDERLEKLNSIMYSLNLSLAPVTQNINDPTLDRHIRSIFGNPTGQCLKASNESQDE